MKADSPPLRSGGWCFKRRDQEIRSRSAAVFALLARNLRFRRRIEVAAAEGRHGAQNEHENQQELRRFHDGVPFVRHQEHTRFDELVNGFVSALYNYDIAQLFARQERDNNRLNSQHFIPGNS